MKTFSVNSYKHTTLLQRHFENFMAQADVSSINIIYLPSITQKAQRIDRHVLKDVDITGVCWSAVVEGTIESRGNHRNGTGDQYPATCQSRESNPGPQWCTVLSRPCLLYEPHHKKTCLWDLRPGKTQIGLRSHRSWIEA